MSITDFDYLITKKNEMTEVTYEAKINSKETNEESSQQRKKFAVEKTSNRKIHRLFRNDVIEKRD